MKEKILYQTLQDRGNPEEVEDNAPFLCQRKNAWLGQGYYFWDTFIKNAHWWGEKSYGKSYIICSFYCDFDDKCFDLVGNTEHMLDFSKSIDFLHEKGLFSNPPSVSRVLEFIKKRDFKYEAIRVYGINSLSNKETNYVRRLFFDISKPQYLDIIPAIQICIFTRKGLNLRNCEVVYPEEYVQNCVF